MRIFVTPKIGVLFGRNPESQTQHDWGGRQNSYNSVANCRELKQTGYSRLLCLNQGSKEFISSHSPKFTCFAPMVNVDRAYNKVRNELAEVGLLADGVYLDSVELCVSDEKSGDGEWGYVFERVGHYADRGYRPGVIYLPRDLPHLPYSPGWTLTDTIRHEYAHAWFYLDPGFFRQEWFVKTFGAAYSNPDPIPYQQWQRKAKRNPGFDVTQGRKGLGSQAGGSQQQIMLQHFISEYATTNASEDFAETFMFFLKYRRSLQRFAKRPIVYQKLTMVQQAVAAASRKAKRSRRRNQRVASE